jgi:hypothetical protein
MYFFLLIIYAAVGLVLATPYCLLAGWDTDAFIAAVMALPIGALIWGLLANGIDVVKPNVCGSFPARFDIKKALEVDEPTRPLVAICCFWALTIYLLLPILLNGLSLWLEMVGQNHLSYVIFMSRYQIMMEILALVAAISAIMVVAWLSWDFLVERTKRLQKWWRKPRDGVLPP